jgi:hypothetical protein
MFISLPARLVWFFVGSDQQTKLFNCAHCSTTEVYAGHEQFITYIDEDLPRAQRQAELEAGYGVRARVLFLTTLRPHIIFPLVCLRL